MHMHNNRGKLSNAFRLTLTREAENTSASVKLGTVIGATCAPLIPLKALSEHKLSEGDGGATFGSGLLEMAADRILRSLPSTVGLRQLQL